MNQHDLQFRIRQHLNASTRELSPDITSRLHKARQKALDRQKVAVGGLSLAGIGSLFSNYVAPKGRSALAMLLIILAVVGSGFLGELQRTAEMEELDSALLADDLPIDAYLDRGFDAWVQNDSPE
ncbi:hypothetical protein GCM10007933_01380 [Zoogloea oryzae]|jgi:hypothetical protein|uniref:DUF3619 family protein n=1 Tax=Zoogloea oryzae TaxID=310767 RepID=A0ABQ6F612_9RHOO|nr:DUF3619 family protein [Zoogloea oryzae]GLT20687.1 hypothetical protein GCM10007933_01380 [Zoogloea oryzae]